MNNLVAVIGCLCALSLPLKSFSQPIQPMIQVEEKAKKEQVFTIIGPKYVLASTIIHDFFTAAKIKTFSMNRKEINKIEIPDFIIFEKNFDETKYLLEKFLNVQFETDEKKSYYMVKKKWKN